MPVLSDGKLQETAYWDGAQDTTRFGVCAGPECRGGWRDWLRSRVSVRLDGRKLCSQNCAEAYLQNLLRRHRAAVSMRAQPHRHRIPIGLVMLAQGWITPEQLQSALSEQRITREETGQAGRIGYFLDRQGAATEDTITRALGLQWNCPVFDLRTPPPADAAWLPPTLAEAYRCLPLREGPQGTLLLAFDGVLDAQAVYAVQHIHDVEVTPGLLPESSFQRALAGYADTALPRVEQWNCSGFATLARRLARWIWQDSGAELRSVVLHNHLWLHSVRGSRDLVVALDD